MRDPFVRQLWINFSIIFAAIIFAAIALFWVLSDVSAHAAAIARAQAGVAVRNANIGALTQLEASAPRAVQYESAFKKLLPIRDNLIQFPRQMQVVAAAYNVATQIGFAGDPATPPPGTIGMASFSLTASGKSDDLFSFLQYLETQTPEFLVSIDSVDWSSSGGNARLISNGRVFFQ